MHHLILESHCCHEAQEILDGPYFPYNLVAQDFQLVLGPLCMKYCCLVAQVTQEDLKTNHKSQTQIHSSLYFFVGTKMLVERQSS